MCRLLHGAPFAPWTNIQHKDLQWIRKELIALKLLHFATGTVCGVCHAPITMTYKAAPDEVGIVAVSIDEGKSSGGAIPQVERHIYVSQRPSWYKILDMAVQYEGVPEDMKDYAK